MIYVYKKSTYYERKLKVEVIFTKVPGFFRSQCENYFPFHINFQEKCCILGLNIEFTPSGRTRSPKTIRSQEMGSFYMGYELPLVKDEGRAPIGSDSIKSREEIQT